MSQSQWDGAERDFLRGAKRGALIGVPILVVVLVGGLLLCAGLVAACLLLGLAGTAAGG